MPVATLSAQTLPQVWPSPAGHELSAPLSTGIDAELHVDVEAVRGNAEDLVEQRLALQRVVLGDAAAEDPHGHAASSSVAKQWCCIAPISKTSSFTSISSLNDSPSRRLSFTMLRKIDPSCTAPTKMGTPSR